MSTDANADNHKAADTGKHSAEFQQQLNALLQGTASTAEEVAFAQKLTDATGPIDAEHAAFQEQQAMHALLHAWSHPQRQPDLAAQVFATLAERGVATYEPLPVVRTGTSKPARRTSSGASEAERTTAHKASRPKHVGHTKRLRKRRPTPTPLPMLWASLLCAAALLLIIFVVRYKPPQAVQSLTQGQQLTQHPPLPPPLNQRAVATVLMSGADSRLENSTQALVAQQALYAGAVLHVPSALRLQLRDGSILNFGSSKRIALETSTSGVHVTLSDATLDAVVSKQAPGQHLTIIGRYAAAVIIGTQFNFTDKHSETSLLVKEGHVRFEPVSAGDSEPGAWPALMVDAGHSARAGATGLLHPLAVQAAEQVAEQLPPVPLTSIQLQIAVYTPNAALTVPQSLPALLDAIKRAGARGADLLVTPATVLHSENSLETGEAKALLDDVPALQAIQQAAQAQHMSVVVGLLRIDGKQSFNSGLFISAEGQTTFTHDKVILASRYLSLDLRSGKGWDKGQSKWGRIGIVISKEIYAASTRWQQAYAQPAPALIFALNADVDQERYLAPLQEFTRQHASTIVMVNKYFTDNNAAAWLLQGADVQRAEHGADLHIFSCTIPNNE